MATNADETTVVADDDAVTEDDLRDLKYGDDVEASQEADETETNEGDENTEASEEAGQTDDQAEEETPSFVKQFPQIKGETPGEYAKNLELAYQNSTAEFQRLRGEQTKEEEKPPIDTSDPLRLYAQQKLDEDIQDAFSKTKKQYPQATDPTEYAKFTNTVNTLTNTILQSEGRMAKPSELYRKAAVILDWDSQTPNSDDKLKNAVRDATSSSKTSSSTKRNSPSKVTDAMVAASKKMYPNKSDSEIREELEPYV